MHTPGFLDLSCLPPCNYLKSVNFRCVQSANFRDLASLLKLLAIKSGRVESTPRAREVLKINIWWSLTSNSSPCYTCHFIVVLNHSCKGYLQRQCNNQMLNEFHHRTPQKKSRDRTYEAWFVTQNWSTALCRNEASYYEPCFRPKFTVVSSTAALNILLDVQQWAIRHDLHLSALFFACNLR